MGPFKSVSELLSGPMVTILVGRNRTPYLVHREVLCNRSAHFRAALQGQFKEAQTRQIEFLEEHEYTFKLFLHWVYTLVVPSCGRDGLSHYISLICFARSILLEELHNGCIDKIRELLQLRSQSKDELVVPTKELSLVYEAMPELPKLRFLVCLEAALEYTSKAQIGVSDWMDPGLTQLLEQGGDLASDLPKLLVYCNTTRSAPSSQLGPGAQEDLFHGYPSPFPPGPLHFLETGRAPDKPLHEVQRNTLSPAYNCLFHEHHGAATCGTVKLNSTVHVFITGASRCFDKKRPEQSTKQASEQGGGSFKNVIG
ncbi:MAG: hypothetical protein Q9166_003672 [cf. Caloplaca sp. 2 TL-2023]